jgi:ketosteroid isomerase-like protein
VATRNRSVVARPIGLTEYDRARGQATPIRPRAVRLRQRAGMTPERPSANGGSICAGRRQTDSVNEDQAAVLAAAQERAEALVAGDSEALEKILHPDLRWTTYRGEVKSRSAYVAGNTDGSLRWLSQRLEEPAIAVIGDTAVLTAVVIDQVDRDGRHETYRLRMTQTWIREHGRWRCLAGHAGPPI